MYLLNDDELKSSKIISSKLLFSFFIIFNNELIVGKEWEKQWEREAF